MIYTLVGSLLMLAGAVALGVLATPEGGEISFSLAEPGAAAARRGHPAVDLRAVRRGVPGQGAAVPAARLGARHLPVHADPGAGTARRRCSRRSASTASCGSCCRSCPTPPSTSRRSCSRCRSSRSSTAPRCAFTQDDARLVVAYFSIAQMGFITLGIFALDQNGAQGALMQMVNHGLVVAPLFFIIAVLAARTGGQESLERMGKSWPPPPPAMLL